MIYITCPAKLYTGGPTLAHQLCSVLNKNDIESKMLYYGKNIRKDESPVNPKYTHFNVPYVTKVNDKKEDIIIILETKTTLVKKYKNAKKYIWWMSVDNYYKNVLSVWERILKKFKLFKFDLDIQKKKKRKKLEKLLSNRKIFHLVQSEYAKQFLLNNKVNNNNIFFLTDYIEDEIITLSSHLKMKKRENIILYNPRKGLKYTEKIIKEMEKYEEFKFVPLINMSKDEIVEKLCTSKLYIDFGNHPGKDRFPREAVACGCCVITGKSGSAFNDKDIPIGNEYKFFDNDEEIPKIVEKIKYIMANYDDCYNDFSSYYESIMNEKKVFNDEVLKLFKRKDK